EDEAAAFRAAFAAEIAETLRREPRQIPSKYFYDELGSALFEAICRLPWYRITRAETAMLVRHARDIFRDLRRPVTLAELGCGGPRPAHAHSPVAARRRRAAARRRSGET